MALTKVSTDGVKDDAITKSKIPANQIEASELADNAVDTNAIANNAVTAGKLASGVQTTINNNADNRVITGSGTANTLEGESNLTFDGSTVTIGANAPKLKFNELNGDPDYFINANAGELNIHDDTNGSTKLTITPTKTVFPNNNVGINEATPLSKLHVKSADTGASSVSPNANEFVIENTGNCGMTLQSANDGVGNIFFGDVANGSVGRVSYDHASNYMYFQTNAAERMRIDSSGNVGIGTASPTAASSETTLNIYANEYPEVHLTSSVTGTAAGDGSIFTLNNDSSTIIRNQENSYIRFDTNGSNERMRILAGGGLTFNGDTAAANALDDYEEGTWTPNPHGYWSGGWRQASYTGNVTGATYTKIGRLVYFKCYVDNVNFTNNASGANARIYGLPYTVADDGYGYVAYLSHVNMFGNTNTGSFYIAPGNTHIHATKYGEGSIGNATWSTSSGLYGMISGVYQAA